MINFSPNQGKLDMLHTFVGRKRELQMLDLLFKKKSASLVVIRGRRRIGKSRLAQEFAKKTPHYVFSGLPPTKDITANAKLKTDQVVKSIT